jgi:hypothetical protein
MPKTRRGWAIFTTVAVLFLLGFIAGDPSLIIANPLRMIELDAQHTGEAFRMLSTAWGG